MFEKLVVIDCRGHLLGRLASTIAKELLSGQKIVAVRAEEINISGPFMRNKLKFHSFLRLHVNTNPSRGPFHHKSPARILYRCVRGMIKHKTVRGANAMNRFKSFEGCPAPYDKLKRMVVPQALRILRLRRDRKYTILGELAQSVGWKQYDLIRELEAKRLERSHLYWLKKQKEFNMRLEARRQLCKKNYKIATSQRLINRKFQRHLNAAFMKKFPQAPTKEEIKKKAEDKAKARLERQAKNPKHADVVKFRKLRHEKKAAERKANPTKVHHNKRRADRKAKILADKHARKAETQKLKAAKASTSTQKPKQ